MMLEFQGMLDACPSGLRHMEEDQLVRFVAAIVPLWSKSSSLELFEMARIPKAADCYEQRMRYG